MRRDVPDAKSGVRALGEALKHAPARLIPKRGAAPIQSQRPQGLKDWIHAMTSPIPVAGPLDHISDTALLERQHVAELKIFGSLPKLDADRAAGRGLPFIRYGGQVFYVGGELKRALAAAIAAGTRSRAEAMAAARAPVLTAA